MSWAEAAYGPVDMKNDFFSADLDTYFKTDEINPETNSVQHKIIKLASFGDSLEKMSNADIWSMKVQAPNGGKKYDLINIKGFNSNDRPVSLSDVEGTVEGTSFFDATKKGQVGLRDFINADLSKESNELYQGFNKLIQENAEFFANSLIDIVLKTKMQTKLQSKEIGDYFFEFALVTGYADYTPKKKGDDVLNLKPAKVLPQHTILCGLANLAANNKPYLMVYDGDAKADANAAKVFYKLKRDGVTILDLQLRYKGDFKSQPQFQAFLSPQFKSLLKGDFGNARNIIFG